MKHLLFLAGFALAAQCSTPAPGAVTHINDLIIHDPHILADTSSQTYYIYGQYSPKREWIPLQSPHGRAGVLAYTSKDLEHWEGPRLVFEIPENFWADPTDAPWAPEVHQWRGKYYLFVTFNDWKTTLETKAGRPPITKRQCQILVANSPLGPFQPFRNAPHTPAGDMTLDATLYVDPEQQPWLVYAHEWIQTTDGLICAIRLTDDFSATMGDPITLIAASQVPWTKREINYRGTQRYPGIVTDGPSLYRTKTGALALFWASWSQAHLYAESLAMSASGKLTGPWVHAPGPLLQDDRGHGSVFRAFDDRLLLVLHRYFKQPATRVQIHELEDAGDTVRVKRQILGAP